MSTENITTKFIQNLSAGALRVFDALLKASLGNGDDFGLSGQAYGRLPDMTPQQFAAYIGHLDPIFEWKEDLSEDPGVTCCDDVQYGLKVSAIASRSYVNVQLVELFKQVGFTPEGFSAS